MDNVEFLDNHCCMGYSQMIGDRFNIGIWTLEWYFPPAQICAHRGLQGRDSCGKMLGVTLIHFPCSKESKRHLQKQAGFAGWLVNQSPWGSDSKGTFTWSGNYFPLIIQPSSVMHFSWRAPKLFGSVGLKLFELYPNKFCLLFNNETHQALNWPCTVLDLGESGLFHITILKSSNQSCPFEGEDN